MATVNRENIMINGLYYCFPPLFMTITIQCSLMASVHVSGCIADKKSKGAHYGNGAMMNVVKQLKLNLNCITCCFEYTSLICPSLMYYQVQGAELL